MNNDESRFCADCDRETPVKYMAAAPDNRGLICRGCRKRNREKAQDNAQRRLFGDQANITDLFDKDGRAEFNALFS